MKPHHVVLVATALYIFAIAFAAGALSATQTSVEMPLGPTEFILNRYQALIAGFIAMLGIWGVFRQVKMTALQHKAMMLFNIEPERRALQDIRSYALALRAFVVSELEPTDGIILLDKTLPTYDVERRRLVEGELSPAILHALERVRREVKAYNDLLEPGGLDLDNPLWMSQARIQFKKVQNAVDGQNQMTLGRWDELKTLLDIDPDTVRHG